MWPDWFFIQAIPPNAETGTYDYRLVLLSYVVATLASYTAFTSATQLISADRKLRWLWQTGGAFALGSGIWSMHFIGMLAFNMRMVMEYDVILTAISLLIAWAVAFSVLGIVQRPSLRPRHIGFSALLLGLGICAMHYTGMASMQMDGDIRYLPAMFFLSVAIAISASAAALWLLFTLTRSEHRWRRRMTVASAFVMGAAICGMHYSGMAGTVFIPWADCRIGPNQDSDQLAIIVAAISMIAFLSTHFIEGIVNFFNKQDISRRVFAQLTALLALLMVLVLSSFMFIVNALSDQNKDNLNVTVAGLQRTLIQRYLREVTSVLASQNIHDWEGVIHNSRQLSSSEKIIENNFNAMIRGGEVIINFRGTKTDWMEAIDYPEAKRKLPLVRENWNELKRLALIALRENSDYQRRESTYSTLAKLADKTTELEDEVIQSLIKEMEEDATFVESAQTIILILNIFCFIAIIYYAKYRVELPIKTSIDKQKDMEMQLLAHRDHLQQMVDAQTESLQEEAQTITLLQNVSSVANQARTIEEALRPVLQLLCLYMKWQVGHVYLLDPEGKEELVSSGIWYFENQEKAQDLKACTESTRLAPGVDIPGRVLKSGQSLWIKDIAVDQNFTRIKSFKDGYIRTAIAFPVTENGKVVMVPEFFSTQMFDVDEDTLMLFEGVAMQISIVVERVRIENTLIQARRAAVQANNLKSDFLANISHELRTPMHSIITFSRQGIERKTKWTPDEQAENLALIKASGERLLGLLNDLLDLSKLEAGAMKYDFKKSNLPKLIENAVHEVQGLAEKKWLTIKPETATSLPEILCDQGKIMQVFINLMSNAIKFTPEHKAIYVSCDTYQNDPSYLHFQVVDEGIGIPEAELETVFDKFVQSSKTKTGAGGTGLGLAICKEIVIGHGGKIWAENSPSGGAHFSVLLPINPKKGI